MLKNTLLRLETAGAAAQLYKHLLSVLAFYSPDWSAHHGQEYYIFPKLFFLEGFGKLLIGKHAGPFSRVKILRDKQQAHQSGKGRIKPLLPLNNLSFIKIFIIVIHSIDYSVMAGSVCLKNNPARRFSPARAACDLGYEGKSPLPAAVIGQLEHSIGRNYAHQRHRGEIQPLGYHLSAD